MNAALSDLLGRPLSELYEATLEPEGKYQSRTLTLPQLTAEVIERLSAGFAHRSAASFPHLVCISGKCRTGSTALTNLFGIAAVPAFYQPVKTILRHRVLNEPGDAWALPSADADEVVAAKEMTGPYTLAECLFNPIQCLIEAGYPRERLHLLLLDRDPHESLASWRDKWSDRLGPDELLRNFALASVNAERLRDYAGENEVDAVTYVYGLARWPHEAISALFQRLGIGGRFHAAVVDDWGARGAIESDRSPVIFPEEPDPYRVVGLHSSEAQYRFKTRETDVLTATDRALIEDVGLADSYRRSLEHCCRDLALPDPIREQVMAWSAGVCGA